MLPVIERDKPLLITEIFPALQQGSPVPWLTARQDALMSMLQANGYLLYRIKETERGGYRRLERVQALATQSGASGFNYLAAPGRLQALIERLKGGTDRAQS